MKFPPDSVETMTANIISSIIVGRKFRLSGISGLDYRTGILNWNTELEYWNGLYCCKKPFLA